MKRFLGIIVLAWFAIWNTNTVNWAGQPIHIGIGPFSSYGECSDFVDRAGGIPGMSFEGCKFF
jgi:hypothetical protein